MSIYLISLIPITYSLPSFFIKCSLAVTKYLIVDQLIPTAVSGTINGIGYGLKYSAKGIYNLFTGHRKNNNLLLLEELPDNDDEWVIINHPVKFEILTH